MGQKVASLEIELAMATGGAVSDLTRFGGVVDKVSAQAIRDLDRIDAATKTVGNMDAATQKMVRFADEGAKSAIATAREMNRVEQAGERVAAQLERQIGAYGKTSSEIRSMKAETAALAAEQAGQIELAGRIRVAEQALYDAEYAAMRQASQAAKALAEDRAMAAAQAVLAADREATATREAAHAHALFEAAVRSGVRAMKEAEAVQMAAKREADAAATRDAAFAHQLFEARVREGATALREAESAAARDATALARLRELLDPAAAAQDRLNAEMAEAQRVMTAAGMSTEEVIRVQAALGQQHGKTMTGIGGGARLAGHHTQNLAFQFQDLGQQMVAAAGSSEPMKMAFMAIMQQGLQIRGIMTQAGIGIRGVGAAFLDMTKAVLLATVTNPYLMAFAAAAAAAAVAVKLLQSAANDGDGGMKAYAQSLGLTAKEIRQLDDVTVTFGDTAKAVFQVAGAAIASVFGPAVKGVWAVMKEWLDWLAAGAKATVNYMIGAFVGGYAAIKASWSKLPSAMGDLFFSAVNLSIDAVNALVRKSVDAVNGFIGTANGVLAKVGLQLPELQAGQIGRVNNQFAGAAATVGKTFHDEIVKAAKVDYLGAIGGAIVAQAQKNARDRIRKQAEDKGYLDPETDTPDKAAKKIKEATDLAALQAQFAMERAKHVQDLMEQWSKSIAVDLKLPELPAAPDIIGGLEQQLEEHQDVWSGLIGLVQRAGSAFADAWGPAGEMIGNASVALATYAAEHRRVAEQREIDLLRTGGVAEKIAKVEADYARNSARGQVAAYGEITGAAKSMFSERSSIYRSLQAAEMVFRTVQLAMSLQAVVQNAIETAATVANAGVKAAAEGTAGIAKQSQLPFPYNIAAMAATAAALVGIGVAVLGGGGGGGNTLPAANSGKGTVLGDADAQSESITRAIETLADIDAVTMRHSAGMLASLRAIESRIGGLASLLVRTGNIDASGGVSTGFKSNAAGDVLGFMAGGTAIGALLKDVPVLGDIMSGLGGVVKSLFGSKTSVIASGLFGGPQAIADVLNEGFDASYFSDVKKTKKFFGISAGSKYSTQYGEADSEIEQQFGLILRGFYDTIGAAAGPLGLATADVENRLKGFVVDLGKIDLQGLSGDAISEKLSAVFGAAADDMARAAMPGLERFQAVGEGYFETLTRVAVTMETVSTSLGRLGTNAQGLDIGASMGVAGLFDSLSELTSASDAYFDAFYSDAERTAIRTAQMAQALGGLGVAMPDTLAGYRALVDAQDLTTAAGQQMYATLLQLAPAFADLKGAMDGAASAAAIVRQREDLDKQLLQLSGDTAAIRAAELAKIDPSNRALQQQIWAIEDARAAADAATELRDAWKSVGDTIMDEIRRIRGLSDAGGGAGFAALMGQFNAANAAARIGDMDAAQSLPQLSRSLLDAAALAATSRQELDRVQAQTAAMLEATYGAIGGGTEPADRPIAAVLSTMAATGTLADTVQPTVDLAAEIRALREEVAALRSENNAGHAATAGHAGRMDRRLEAVTAPSGGEAITVASVAA